jgi:hypothetical protein
MGDKRVPGEVWRAYEAAHGCVPELSDGMGGWHWHCRMHAMANFAPQSRESAEAEIATHVTEFTATNRQAADL